MKSIIFNEIKAFYTTPMGFLTIAFFLIVNGYFLWFTDSEYNIVNLGFADLSSFFKISGMILAYLMPAITMKTFSDEKKQGTMELLLTKPLSIWEIVLGKYFGTLILSFFALFPTFIYLYVLWIFGTDIGHFSWGCAGGCYIGLLLLVISYAAIGIFASSLTKSQIIAFLTAFCICYGFYYGFYELANLHPALSNEIAYFGMESHFRSMTQGVIDSRDVLFFVSVAFIFLNLTVLKLKIFNSK